MPQRRLVSRPVPAFLPVTSAMPRVSGLFIYPVKSLRGIAVSEASLDDYGLVGDRRFLLVDENNQFLTQRTLPRMALIETELGRESLVLRNPSHGSAAVGLHDSGPALTVQIWRDTVEAEDCGVEIAVWLSDFLRHPCRLVRIGPAYRRPVKPSKAKPGDAVSFADGYPLLALSEASLADLNDRLVAQGEEPVPMDRFRPNVVLSDCPAFAEDTWTRFKIGNAIFRSSGPCARCIIPTTDQQTAIRYKEPLRTLATYRRDPAEPGNVYFGQNVIHETKSGRIRVGDTVTLLA
jgi:uncharacterized protein